MRPLICWHDPHLLLNSIRRARFNQKKKRFFFLLIWKVLLERSSFVDEYLFSAKYFHFEMKSHDHHSYLNCKDDIYFLGNLNDIVSIIWKILDNEANNCFLFEENFTWIHYKTESVHLKKEQQKMRSK